MRSRPFACLFTVVSLSIANVVHAQDPLDEMYGQAVHSYFRGDSMLASDLLTEVIDAGSLDPRAFFFRGLTQSYGGADMNNPDFERGAQLEIEGKKVVNIGKALERVQGPVRIAIEKARAKARLASRARQLEIQRTRYEEMQQKGGMDNGGIIVPPRNDAAPAPGVFAPNDPFNDGMTKGNPKAMPKKLEEAKDEFAPDTSMPTDALPVPEAKDPNDPF